MSRGPSFSISQKRRHTVRSRRYASTVFLDRPRSNSACVRNSSTHRSSVGVGRVLEDVVERYPLEVVCFCDRSIDNRPLIDVDPFGEGRIFAHGPLEAVLG
jgi:hypothetical protein